MLNITDSKLTNSKNLCGLFNIVLQKLYLIKITSEIRILTTIEATFRAIWNECGRQLISRRNLKGKH